MEKRTIQQRCKFHAVAAAGITETSSPLNCSNHTCPYFFFFDVYWRFS